METAGAEETSQEVLEGFTKMMNRWMKRRIERSRARCATDKHGSTRTESPQTRLEGLTTQLTRVVEKQSLKLRPHAEVQ